VGLLGRLRPAPTASAGEAAKRIDQLERQVRKLRANQDEALAKALRHGYAAGPVVPVDYPGAELKLVAAAGKRQDEHESEPYIGEWIERWFRPDEVFYDIGANVGTYALIAGAVALPQGRIVAFEPVFSTYAVLCDNVVLNGLGDRVTSLPVALGAETGLTTFTYSSVRPGSAKHNWPSGKVAYRSEVLAYRLDDLVPQLGLPIPHHLKIDTDGAEPELLRGARETLASPVVRSLMVELLTWTEDEVRSELAANGFEQVELFERPPSPVTCALFARPGAGPGA
jgi:FkbM family methyltransferase